MLYMSTFESQLIQQFKVP